MLISDLSAGGIARPCFPSEMVATKWHGNVSAAGGLFRRHRKRERKDGMRTATLIVNAGFALGLALASSVLLIF